jgi:hypothetical protein
MTSTPTRVVLSVPFVEKDQAKARWASSLTGTGRASPCPFPARSTGLDI